MRRAWQDLIVIAQSRKAPGESDVHNMPATGLHVRTHKKTVAMLSLE